MPSLLPEKFKFNIGGFHEGHYVIEYDGENLIYEHGYGQKTVVNPSLTEWEIFWCKVDELDIWRWKQAYDNLDILDGTQWNLKLKHNGRTKNSYGSNEYPKTFDAFLKALRKLIGGLPVR